VDELLSIGPFGDGTQLAQDLDVWLDGLMRASTHTDAPVFERTTRSTARSTELRCLFENWPVLGAKRVAARPVTIECVVIDVAGEPPVSRGIVTSLESQAVLLAYADTDLEAFSARPVDSDDVAAVTEAIALLGRVMPRVCANTVGLAPRLVKIANDIPSMHLSGSPGFVYVAERVLGGDTWVLADALLHESLHEKSSLLRKFRGLLRPSYREATSATTFLPWSVDYGEERHFSTWRLLSAGHVYVHLYVLRCALGLRREARIPHDRARFMLDALARPEHDTDLDADGRRMREWLDVAIQTTPEETMTRRPASPAFKSSRPDATSSLFRPIRPRRVCCRRHRYSFCR